MLVLSAGSQLRRLDHRRACRVALIPRLRPSRACGSNLRRGEHRPEPESKTAAARAVPTSGAVGTGLSRNRHTPAGARAVSHPPAVTAQRPDHRPPSTDLAARPAEPARPRRPPRSPATGGTRWAIRRHICRVMGHMCQPQDRARPLIFVRTTGSLRQPTALSPPPIARLSAHQCKQGLAYRRLDHCPHPRDLPDAPSPSLVRLPSPGLLSGPRYRAARGTRGLVRTAHPTWRRADGTAR